MNRIQNVDIFRVFAIFAVILIHTGPFENYSNNINVCYRYLALFINQSARFSIPFFFMISGYFLGVKIKKGGSLISISVERAKKIIIIFLAWSFIFLIFCNLYAIKTSGVLGFIKSMYWYLANIAENPIVLIMEGTFGHLWFLMSLLCALLITAFFIFWGYHKSLIIIALTLYFIGLFGKAYSGTPIGIEMDFNTRNGPFFSTLPFITGYFLSNLRPSSRWLLRGIIIFLIGWVLHFAETYILWVLYGTALGQEYVIGTYFMGLGYGVTALSKHSFFRNEKLGQIGQFTLGIYAIHAIFVVFLKPLDEIFFSLVWQIGYPVIVLMLSIISVLILSKNALFKKYILQ